MELFDKHREASAVDVPLAERMRPQRLEEFIGQTGLVERGRILREALESGRLFSIILWGPPGSGKTTLAKMVTNYVEAQFFQISAVAAGIKDVREVIDRARQNRRLDRKTVLFIDEIHRFNKAQQDGLLHAVEEGLIVLIGATTENPSFEIISPLLSRCKVLKLSALTESDLAAILERVLKEDKNLSQLDISIADNARQFLLKMANGDARKLLNTLAIALDLIGTAKRAIKISLDIVKEALQQRQLLYDKKGDYHYDVISAFIKSVRGSDPDAALYWLAVMLENGEDPLFIARRLLILSSEDVGNASPLALTVANAGYQAVHSVGMPEAAIILGQVTTYLAASPKSNAAYLGLRAAIEEVRSGELPDVPLHLRNAPTGPMKDLQYGENYQYPHDFPDGIVAENYFPKGKKPLTFYRPKQIGSEKLIAERLLKIWKERYFRTEK